MKKILFFIVALLAAVAASAQSQLIKANRVDVVKTEQTAPVADSTYAMRSAITQSVGSSTNRLYNGKFYTTYSGSQNQFIIGGLNLNVSNAGTGTVTSMGGLPVTIYNLSGSTTTNTIGFPLSIYNNAGSVNTNTWGFATNIYSRGIFNKLSAFSSHIYHYNRDESNNDMYGTDNTFYNYGFLDSYQGLQISAYNEGEIGYLEGIMISLGGDSIGDMIGVNLGRYASHKWTGSPTNSYGIYADRSIDRGTSNAYFIYSESRSPLRHFGNFQLDTLRGSGDRIVIADADGKFKATKKDSTYYWNLSYSWGNHGIQGYITDGNTNWDNSYGFITDGNTGWNNSYGFITARPPITANYLVGTANDSLSNEIVVGTSPGGILGGTWATPTIDNYSITQPMLDTYIEGTPDQGKWLGYSAYGMDWLNLPTANASGTQGIATFLAGDFNSTDGEISIDYANATKATAMQHGFLSSTDWGTFNAKIGGSGSAGAVAIFDAINTITNDADFTFNPTSNELTVGSGSGNGSVTSGNFILSSDFRLKTNIKPLSKHEWADAIDFKSFSMKSDKTSRTRYGVIAQEIEKINPELVHTNAKGYKSVAYIDLLVAKVARQDEIIRNLIERINKLEDANEKK